MVASLRGRGHVATGGMAAYLWHHGLLQEPRFIAEQGHWMGRPGQAEVQIVGDGNGDSRRTQAERRAESDSRMLRAATELIAKHGSAGVSLAKIGVAAGYSRGLPTERYGSKSNLLEAVIDASDAWFQRRLAARLAGRSGLDSLRERIRAHLDTVRESRVPTVALFLLIIDSAATLPELRPRVQRLNERWRGKNSLYNPVTNIRYGSYYYQKLLTQFDGHYALALAAYNAGPERVKKWLPEDKSIPADIWIETIPYRETRDYVASVLAYALIYQQRTQSVNPEDALSTDDFIRDIEPRDSDS